LKPKIFFMRGLLPEEEKEVRDVAEYTTCTADEITPEIVAKETKNADAISARMRSYMFLDERTLKNAKGLKVIDVETNTFDNGTFTRQGLDMNAATKLGIYVTNTPLDSEVMAEKTWGLLLSVALKIVEADKFTREGRWKNRNTCEYYFLSHKIRDATLGILGLGRIGKAVASRAKAFNMRTIYYDVIRREDVEKELNIEYVDFQNLLKRSDYVSVHTGPVHHLIGEKELGVMKKGAILINTARGECVDTSALFKALRENRIAGAGLDVFEKEPVDPQDPILTLPNVVLMPHTIGGDLEQVLKLMRMSLANILNVINERMPLSLVNKEVVRIRPLRNR